MPEINVNRFRIALYGGLFGAVGATAGWLTWIAFQTGKSVLIAPAIGVVLELVRKWFEYHSQVSSLEKENQPLVARTLLTPRFLRDSLGRIVITTVLLLLAITLDVAADLIKGVWLPYLQSVVTLFPVGAIFAVSFHPTIFKPGSNRERLLLGLLAGTLVTFVSLLLFFVLGGRAALTNVESSWWVLIGLCFAVAHVELATSGVRSLVVPLASLTTMILLVALLIAFNLDRFMWGGISVIPATVTSVLQGPDLPATSWNTAATTATSSTPIDRKHMSWIEKRIGCNVLPSLELSTAQILSDCNDPMLMQGKCLAPACLNLEMDCPPLRFSQYSPSPNPFETDEQHAKRLQQIESCKQRRTTCSQQIEELKKQTTNAHSQTAAVRDLIEAEKKNSPNQYRQRLLCEQLANGPSGGLARSLLALTLFTLFWGWGRSWEESHRPAGYEKSYTRKLDRIVGLVVLILALAVVVISRFQ